MTEIFKDHISCMRELMIQTLKCSRRRGHPRLSEELVEVCSKCVALKCVVYLKRWVGPGCDATLSTQQLWNLLGSDCYIHCKYILKVEFLFLMQHLL